MSHPYDPDDLIDEVVGLVLAGGAGKRLGSARPKAFVGLAGRVVLAHSLMAFEGHEAVDSIVLVVPDGWLEPTEVLVDDLGCDRVSAIEVGGSCRAASVLAGLDAVASRRQTAVLVHDAARPVLPASVIDRVLAPLAEGFDAVIPTMPVHDSVKLLSVDGAVVEQTLPRGRLAAAQTPQACRSSILREALASLGVDELASVLDCADAVQRAGGRVAAVRGDGRLQKVTTAQDLAELEARFQPPAVASLDQTDG